MATITPQKPHGIKEAIKRIPIHSLFSLVGVGARFLPGPWKLGALGAFTAWRVGAELMDYIKKRDTASKALIDLGSQVGSAAAGAFIG